MAAMGAIWCFPIKILLHLTYDEVITVYVGGGLTPREA